MNACQTDLDMTTHKPCYWYYWFQTFSSSLFWYLDHQSSLHPSAETQISRSHRCCPQSPDEDGTLRSLHRLSRLSDKDSETILKPILASLLISASCIFHKLNTHCLLIPVYRTINNQNKALSLLPIYSSYQARLKELKR